MTAATLTRGPSPRALPAADEAPVGRFPASAVELGGFRLAIRSTAALPLRADRPTAVFVHGLGGSSANWTDVMFALSPHLDGVAVDLPGFGYSDPPPSGQFTIDSHVAAVAALIEHVDRGPVHLFGNSMGGAASTLVAARRPDLVSTLTLVAPALPTYRALAGHVNLLAGLLEPLLRRLPGIPDPRRDASAEDFATYLINLVYADPSRMHATRRAEMIADIERRLPLPYVRDAFRQSLRSLIGHYLPGPRNLWRQARKVDAPVLAILGREDQLVDVGVAGRIARHMRHSRVVVESDLGHVPQMEHPAAVAALVLDRLAELGAADRPM